MTIFASRAPDAMRNYTETDFQAKSAQTAARRRRGVGIETARGGRDPWYEGAGDPLNGFAGEVHFRTARCHGVAPRVRGGSRRARFSSERPDAHRVSGRRRLRLGGFVHRNRALVLHCVHHSPARTGALALRTALAVARDLLDRAHARLHATSRSDARLPVSIALSVPFWRGPRLHFALAFAKVADTARHAAGGVASPSRSQSPRRSSDQRGCQGGRSPGPIAIQR